MSSLTAGYRTDCRRFSGYKPCSLKRPCQGCGDYDPVGEEILLINLDALGDVLRTTALLPAIRRAFPRGRVTWLTRPRALPLIEDHPLVDRAIPLDSDAIVELQVRRFDVLLNADKSRVAGALAAQIDARDKRGFGIDARGVIVPLNREARYLYDTGLDDDLKFRRNLKSEPEMLCEAMGLPYARDPYRLHLPPAPLPGPRRKVGFNTGCSPLFPYKRLPLDTQERAIRLLAPALGEPVLLLGGREDTARNAELAARLGDAAEATPTEGDLREGAAHVARCEVVVTGDSLGLHLGVALGCHVVAWFGVTCPQEIDLYGRGVKLLADVGCAPCWRRGCDNEPKCFDAVDPGWIRDAALACLDARAAGRPLDAIAGGGWWPPAA